MLGTGLGIVVSSVVAEPSVFANLIAFGFFSGIHLGCLYRSLSYASLPTLNSQRLGLVIEDFLSTGTIATVESVGHKEKLFEEPTINIGVPLDMAYPTHSQFENVRRILRYEKYLLAVVVVCTLILLAEDLPDLSII